MEEKESDTYSLSRVYITWPALNSRPGWSVQISRNQTMLFHLFFSYPKMFTDINSLALDSSWHYFLKHLLLSFIQYRLQYCTFHSFYVYFYLFSVNSFIISFFLESVTAADFFFLFCFFNWSRSPFKVCECMEDHLYSSIFLIHFSKDNHISLTWHRISFLSILQILRSYQHLNLTNKHFLINLN